MKKWICIYTFFALFFATNKVHGFTFTVTPTNMTCLGNGTLTINPNNVNPAGTINYVIYKLPDLVAPIAVQTVPFLGGLSAGTYRIIATETDGITTTTLQVDAIINNLIQELEFIAQNVNQSCLSTTSVSVIISAGNPANYEIFSGPIIFPPQLSNTFSGLIAGVYNIRVFDVCGNGVVRTHTVVINPVGLTIGQPTYTNTSPPSCSLTNASNIVTPAIGTVIGYPLNIQYTINPPGGVPPIISNVVVNSGDPNSFTLSQIIPLFSNQSYVYNITINDACGSVYTSNFTVSTAISITETIEIGPCGQNFFFLTPTNFTPPYTLNFATSPAGFNPVLFNSNYPGPYNDPEVIFGSFTNPTPYGQYTVTIIDACGKIGTRVFNNAPLPPQPSGSGTSNGCSSNSGQLSVTIPNHAILTAIIISAPPSYPFPTPHDVSSSISSTSLDNTLTLNPVPVGSYTFIFTTICPEPVLPYIIVVPAPANQGLTSIVLPGCANNRGSISISSLNGKLTSVIITAGPPSFNTPAVASSNIIFNGTFYMNNLPAGIYTFRCVDECNYTNLLTVTIQGYTIISSSFSVQANCGSFNIPLNFTSNNSSGQTFWLQKEISPNMWGHPETGVVYAAGTNPTTANSLSIQNNAVNLNLAFNGIFRILTTFNTFYNGSEINSGTLTTVEKVCIEILNPLLTFNQSLEITNINRMPCTNNGNLDVIIFATGVMPLRYKIVEQNGLPFFIDNGNSNIFVGLPQGIYKIQVEDNCGNIRPKIFDIPSLVSLVNLTGPRDILQCKNTITGNEIFNLATLNTALLGTQSASNYTISYYNSLTDAQSALNPIVNLTNFNPISNPQTIYAKGVYNPVPMCYETTPIVLIVGKIPELLVNSNYLLCENSSVTINASLNNLPTTSYVWSNGSTLPSITVDQVGVTELTITATNLYGLDAQACTNTKDITVTISEIPKFDRFETSDWTDNENTITVFTINTGTFEYSIDGFNYQDSPTFNNLRPGLYTIYIKDKLGCGIIEEKIWLLNYPKFFTPNGDGYNDTWFIKNSIFEPNFQVEIFDRYGKFITNFNSSSIGWDGNYNGNQMSSSDYWFVVHREDGRVHKGHFAMKR